MHIEERLSTFLEKNPSVSEKVYIAPSATVVGDVRIGRDASIWFGAILRGDINFITKVSDARFGLIGGRFLGEATLLRFYVLHCIGLPFIIMIFMAVHFWRIRKDGGISSPV